MNDGPHKSLPLKPHWKTVARKIADLNYSTEEISEALDYALRKEFLEVPCAAVSNAICIKPDELFTLDISERIEQLEAARELCRGSAMGESYIDSMVCSAISNASESEATVRAVADSSARVLHASMLSMVEHYKREGHITGAKRISGRWDEAVAKCPIEAYASEIAERQAVRVRGRAVKARTDLNAGPPLD